jgi:hypothetical protein
LLIEDFPHAREIRALKATCARNDPARPGLSAQRFAR